MAFSDDFDAPELDRGAWLPHYLPHWSSREASAATFAVEGSELRLTIPPEQGLWCAGDHEPPLRVSGVAVGLAVRPAAVPRRPAGALRSTAWWGVTPHHGRLEVRARMDLSPRSMASVWMVGIEDEPHRSGEICLFEVFGDAPARRSGWASTRSGTRR